MGLCILVPKQKIGIVLPVDADDVLRLAGMLVLKVHEQYPSADAWR